jgi:hypothetical protein
MGSTEIKTIIDMTIHFNAMTVAHDEQCSTFYTFFFVAFLQK